uniref:Glucuronosyltransferase n=1 Tax=Panagrolaimus sp. ES5 TaxID=591445 RepID=A0AC34FCC3_9BILA
MNLTAIIFILTIFFIVENVDSSKILFICPSLSNSIIMQTGRLADILVEDGHNVTFFIPELVSINKKDGSKLAKIQRMEGFTDAFLDSMRSYGNLFDPKINTISARIRTIEAQVLFCKEMLERKNELKAFKNEKYDLILTNGLDFCDIGLMHWMAPKAFVWLVTGPLHETNSYPLGIPSFPSYLPTLEDTLLGTEMTFFERAENLWNWVVQTVLHQYTAFRVFYEVGAKSSLLFINDDEFLDFARPILHKTIYIGGAGLQKPKPLNRYFENIMHKGAFGTVLVSFGTAVFTPALCPEKKREMIKAFGQFPQYHFLMKITPNDNDTIQMGYGIPNVEFVEWMPQTDILAHPNCKAFISHGGFNSILETTMRGVPVIVLPMFFDHFRNGKMVEHRGSGLVIPKTNLGQESLEHSLKELLYNPKYKIAAERLKNLMATKPNQPDQTFLKWTNFLLQQENLPELIPIGATMNIFAYLSLDVIAALIFSIFISLWALRKLFSYFTLFTFLKIIKIKVD